MRERLAVRVHPGARRNAIRGWLADGSLKIEVTAPPEGGRANEAVAEIVSAALGIRKAQVAVVHGAGSRKKTIEIDGLGAADLRRRIEDALNASNQP